MPEQWNDPETFLFGALSVFLAVMVRLLLKARPIWEPRLTAWVDAKVANIKNETFRSVVSAIRDEVRDVVHELSQVMVPEIREAAADGKITADERAKIKDAFLNKIKGRFDWSEVGPTLEKRGISPDKLDDWLLGLMEAEVHRMKMAKDGVPLED